MEELRTLKDSSVCMESGNQTSVVTEEVHITRDVLCGILIGGKSDNV